jgi:hypothetical protein
MEAVLFCDQLTYLVVVVAEVFVQGEKAFWLLMFGFYDSYRIRTRTKRVMCGKIINRTKKGV